MKTEQTNEVQRLPLWKNALDEMRAQGISHAQTYKAEFFEEHLKAPRNTMQFSLAISKIRGELLRDGYYLSGRGLKGNAFVVVPAANNADVLQAFVRQASEALRNGVILGTNTRVDLLSESERRKHEAITERIAVKCALVRRSEKIGEIVAKQKPELLK